MAEFETLQNINGVKLIAKIKKCSNCVGKPDCPMDKFVFIASSHKDELLEVDSIVDLGLTLGLSYADVYKPKIMDGGTHIKLACKAGLPGRGEITVYKKDKN